MKKRQARDIKDGNKQVGKKTEMISLNMVLFSRLCVCDSRDIGISWCGKSPMERTVPSPWKLIMAQETTNAILNEMSHPGECHMNQCPSLRMAESEGFLSQQKKYYLLQEEKPWQVTATWNVSHKYFLTHGMDVFCLLFFIQPSRAQSIHSTETMLFFFDLDKSKVCSCYTLFVSMCSNLGILLQVVELDVKNN